MKRFLILAAVGVLALGLSSTASANYCSFDAVPSATLLFPFVAFDYDAGTAGQTTLMTVINTSSEAQIVHITVWSDYSVAVLDFNLTMTGYDVTQMNIRDILALGLLPTEDPDSNPVRKENIWVDDFSNNGPTPLDWGPWSTHNDLQPVAPAGLQLPTPQSTTPLDCDPADWISSPVNYVGAIPQNTLDVFEGYLRASQTADREYLDCANDTFNFDQDTWFITRDGGPAWMYVTADVVAACNKDLPDGDAASYFNNARATTDGVLDDNVLVGDVVWLDAENRFSEADQAVHLESILESQYPFPGQVPTFYFRYTQPLFPNAYDGREPLPTAWAIRYRLEEANGVNTWIRAFKGSSLLSTVADLADSDVGPNWGGITDTNPSNLYASACVPYTYYAWDDDENVNSVTTDEDPWSGTEDPIRPIPNLMPLETQEVDINQFFIVKQDDDAQYNGWLLIVWPGSNNGPINPIPNDPRGDWYQTWVGARYSAFGEYTAALTGAVMGNYNCDQTQVLPVLGWGLYHWGN
jgi:hypothetical protein